jgi:hypothetical protein
MSEEIRLKKLAAAKKILREEEEQLLALEQAKDDKKDMKRLKNDQTTSQETLMDPVFKELLAPLQNDIIKLTITLQLKQHVKKELTKKLG